MRKFWAAAILALFLAPAAFAGQPFDEDSPEQRTMPPEIVVVTPPPAKADHTAIYVGALSAILVAGITTFGVVKSRKG